MNTLLRIKTEDNIVDLKIQNQKFTKGTILYTGDGTFLIKEVNYYSEPLIVIDENSKIKIIVQEAIAELVK